MVKKVMDDLDRRIAAHYEGSDTKPVLSDLYPEDAFKNSKFRSRNLRKRQQITEQIKLFPE